MDQDLRTLPDLARDLMAAGFQPVSYNRAYMAALNGMIPAKKGRNGRWTYLRGDLPQIAAALTREAPALQLAQAIQNGIEAAQDTDFDPPPPRATDNERDCETVSFHIHAEMRDLITELAALRLEAEKRDRRMARKTGAKPPQSRKSGSAIVRAALEAYRPTMEAERDALRARLLPY